MATNTGVRQANRVRVDSAIRAAARRQLASVGAAGISLREIARELGMVSSAVYRYVSSRDELLTQLIVESYNALGEATEQAIARASGVTDLRRWVAGATAVRTWALANRHDFELLYGTPVPGYAAPPDTVGPGIRVTLALVAVVRDADAAGRLQPPAEGPPLSRAMHADLRRLASDASIAIAPAGTLAFLVAWTQLFGLVTFELNGQTRGLTAHDAALFEAAARQSGHNIGLR